MFKKFKKVLKKYDPEREAQLREQIEREGGIEKKDMPALEAISLWLFGQFGTDGYSEIIISVLGPVFKALFNAIGSAL